MPSSQTASSATVARPAARPIAVLIVDDSVTIRAMMEQVIVNDPGFDVAGIASSAEAARVMMQTVPHDVVTLDLAMPGMGGFRFLDELAAGQHVPVVVVSSATRRQSAAEAEALERGAFACVDKAGLMSDTPGFLRTLRHAGTRRRR